MKPTSLPTDRQIVWLPILKLSVHDAVLATPEETALIDLLAEEFASGEPIRDPIEITPAHEILDGRHRWKAARRTVGMKEVPCVVTDADPESVVLAKLAQRRHYSKSARAYALRNHAASVARLSREAAAKSLIPGNKAGISRGVIQSLDEKKGSETLTELAAKSGLSVDVLKQAIKLERDYMTRADKLVADWLELNEPQAAEWEQWQAHHPSQAMPWSCFRSSALSKLGVRDSDPKAVNLIPKNYREIEEDKIFNGVADPDSDSDERKSYSLGAALKALGSIFATAGKPRPDLDPGTPDLTIVLGNKVKTFTKTMWAQWSDIGQAERLIVCKQLAASIQEWPEDARAALFAALQR